MDKYKIYATKAASLIDLKAIDKALGLPRKGVNVGPGPHAPIPDTYSPGAVGWTETECSVVEADDKTVLVTLTDAAAALGKRDVVVDGVTVKLDLTAGVVADVPPKYLKP